MSGPRWSTGSWLGPERIAVSDGELKELVRNRSLDQVNGDVFVDRFRLKRIPCHVHVNHRHKVIKYSRVIRIQALESFLRMRSVQVPAVLSVTLKKGVGASRHS